MKIITISGLDGSGKSTQIQLLKDYLESQGRRVFYFHAVEFSLANKIARFFSCHSERNEVKSKNLKIRSFASAQDDTNAKSVIRANWFQIWLRKIFLKIDIWRFDLLRNKLLNNRYDYILSDRYFYDSVINIEYLADKSYSLDSRLRGNDMDRPDIAIYLQTSPENIMQRARIPDQGMDYLKKKKELYDSKIADWNFKVIDGNKNKEEIFEEIKKASNIAVLKA